MYTFIAIRPFTEAQVSSTGSGEPYTPSKKLLEGTQCFWKPVSYIPAEFLHMERALRITRMLMIYGILLLLLALGCGSVAYAGAKRKQAEAEVRQHRDYLKRLLYIAS